MKGNGSVRICFLLLLIVSYCHAQQAMSWGTFLDQGCTQQGIRKYSSMILNVPSGMDWFQACVNMPAAFYANGRTYTIGKPDQCHSAGGMWGDFFVNDSTCGYQGRRLLAS
eukprot:jgi/Botrbrau1/20214/Bobra.31_1s0011.1